MPKSRKKAKTAPTHEIHVLTPEEIRTLIRLCSGSSNSGVRGRALIAVLYGAGLRIAEALALRPRDVDLDRLELRVHRGKGGKARTAVIEPEHRRIRVRISRSLERIDLDEIASRFHYLMYLGSRSSDRDFSTI